jgi:rod shape-determining protein MreC
MIRQKSKHSFQAQIIVFLILIIGSGTMLSFSTGGFIINFHNAGFTVLTTFQKGIHAVSNSIGGAVTAVRDLRELQKDYSNLSEKLQNYEYMQHDNAQIREENKKLHDLLGFTETYQYKNIPSQIIGRDISGTYSGLTINKGSTSGIKKNMPVIAIQNGNVGLVGKIVTVGRLTSMILPVYDFDCNVSSRIKSTRDIGICTGNGNQEDPLHLRYIRKRVLDELHYGDLIITSGENDNYLSDIAIGTISAIRTLDYDTSLEIDVTPLIDFARLERVIVVDSKQIQGEE